MEDMVYLKSICESLSFGSLLEVPDQIKNTLEYKVYKIVTEQGKYFIKIFNKDFIIDEKDIERIKTALTLEETLNEHHISIFTANTYKEEKLQKFEDRYFLVYDYVSGKIIESHNVLLEQCRVIGALLCKIHNVSYKEEEKVILPYMHIRWRKYLRLAEHKGSSISKVLSENIKKLEIITENCNNALNHLPNVRTIVHSNLTCSNVLWTENGVKISGNELLQYGNPYIDLIKTALYWAGAKEYKVNYNLFNYLIKEYYKDKVRPKLDWSIVYSVMYKDMLKELEKYIKMALMFDNASKETKEIGETLVEKIIKEIIYYSSIKDEIISRLN